MEYVMKCCFKLNLELSWFFCCCGSCSVVLVVRLLSQMFKC